LYPNTSYTELKSPRKTQDTENTASMPPPPLQAQAQKKFTLEQKGKTRKLSTWGVLDKFLHHYAVAQSESIQSLNIQCF
jgi:hypothetical protein